MRNGSMNELKHNAFLKLNASLPECRSLEREAFAEFSGSLWKLSVSLPMGRSTGRVKELNTTLSYGSRCGVGLSFTEDLSQLPQI